MTLTQEDLNFIIRGLETQEVRYMDDYHKYRVQDNQEAAQDCLDHFHRVYKLRQRIVEISQNGTDVAYTLS